MMTSEFIHEEISIIDYNGLSLAIKDPRLSYKARLSWTIMDNHGQSWTIMDNHGLSWTIIDYYGLSWTIVDYHVSFFANIDSISTTLIFNLITVYPQLFQYIHNLGQYIHNSIQYIHNPEASC